jgi:hypothetical protein
MMKKERMVLIIPQELLSPGTLTSQQDSYALKVQEFRGPTEKLRRGAG